LGLSIASQLVKAHGGEIKVSSNLGKGTVFTINLPTISEGA
jgi:signal transduction histidine kinase